MAWKVLMLVCAKVTFHLRKVMIQNSNGNDSILLDFELENWSRVLHGHIVEKVKPVGLQSHKFCHFSKPLAMMYMYIYFLLFVVHHVKHT